MDSILNTTPPSSPAAGDEWTDVHGRHFVWTLNSNGSGQWVQVPTQRAVVTPSAAPPITNNAPKCTSAPHPPLSPTPNDLWFDTSTGFFFIWYNDGNTYQWVVTNPGRGSDVVPPSSVAAVNITPDPGIVLTPNPITGNGSIGADPAWLSSHYLPITGGTLTGDLLVDSPAGAQVHLGNAWIDLMATTGGPGIDWQTLSAPVDQKYWQLYPDSGTGNALLLGAASDGWSNLATWIFNRDGTTSFPNKVGIGTAAPLTYLDVHANVNGTVSMGWFVNDSTGASSRSTIVQEAGGRSAFRNVDRTGQYLHEVGSNIPSRYSDFDNHYFRNTAGVAQFTIVPTGATFSAVPVVGTMVSTDNSTKAASTAFVKAQGYAVGTIPTALPPNGPAGGDLAGTYPNPTIKPSVTNGQILTTVGGVAAWTTGASVTSVGVTPPGSPPDNSLWFYSDGVSGGGTLYVRYNDGNSSQWVPASPAAGVSGPAGGALQGTYPNPTLVGGPLSNYALTSSIPTTLPPTGAAGGDLAGTYPNPTIKPSVTNGQVLTTVGGVAAWAAASGGSSVAVGVTPPGSPTDGSMWFYSDAVNGGGTLYIRYNDGNTTQWVPVAPAAGASGIAGGDLTGSYPNPTVKASVGLTGTPTAPTVATADNTTSIATTAFVKAQGYLTTTLAGTTYQPLDADLTAIAALATTGIMARTAANTYVMRTDTGTANRVTVTNGDGVAGNPTFDIASTYVGQNTITTLGTIATGTWNGSVVAGQYGGTGVANTGKAITLGGNFTTSGAFDATFTLAGTTTVTFPTSGTLATLASPIFTGNPTAPTPTYPDNDTSIATTAYVTTAIGSAAAVTPVGVTPPGSPADGTMWFYSDAVNGGGQLFFRYNDGTSTQWVPATPTAGASGVAGGDLAGTYPNPTVKASVGLTGTPTAPTATAGTNTTQVATTAFVTAAVAASPAGTVTSASVVSANGLAGTVATATTTPAITLSTTVSGVLKGNGTAISAAVANTDYLPVANPAFTGTMTGTSYTGTTPAFSIAGSVPATAVDAFLISVANASGNTGNILRLRAGSAGTTDQFKVDMTGDGAFSGSVQALALSAPPAGGNAGFGIFLGNFSGGNTGLFFGTGTPTFSTSGRFGSLYMDQATPGIPWFNNNGTTGWDRLVGETSTQTLTNKSLTSPTLTGTPIAPTAGAATNTTQIATTAMVQAAVAAAVPSARTGHVQAATSGGGFTPSTGVDVVIVFATVGSGNTGTWLNTTTGRYTPAAGRYFIQCTNGVQAPSGGNGTWTLAARKNGTRIPGGASSSGSATFSISLTTGFYVDANGTDFFEFVANCAQASMAAQGGSFTAFPI